MVGGNEPSGVLQARYVCRRFLRRAKYMLGHDPAFLPILLRLTPMGISRRITDQTELVVEGFPRAGNTFTVFALQDAAHNQLRISSHVHHPSQVKLAVERDRPTILVVREPIAALSSYLTYAPHGRAPDVLKEYCSYHQELIPYVDRVLVCQFEEIVSDMSSVIERINNRFSLSIPPFDQSPANVDAVFEEIARQHHLLHPRLDPDRVAPRPTFTGRKFSERYRTELLDPRNDARRAESLQLYEYYEQKALEQRAMFQKVGPSRDEGVSERAILPLPSATAEEDRRQSNG
jgi:hypothetical protein